MEDALAQLNYLGDNGGEGGLARDEISSLHHLTVVTML